MNEWDWLKKWVDWSAVSSIVELGCGSARTLKTALDSFAHVEAWGLEVDSVQHAKNLAQPVERLTFVEAPAQAIPAAAHRFDAALMLKSLHHVPVASMPLALAEIARVLKPGGWLFVSEPVYAGDLNAIMRMFNDEGDVRSMAQVALQQALAAGLFHMVQYAYFEVPVHFQDFAEFERRMLSPSYVDTQLDAATRTRIRERFERHLQASGVHLLRPMQCWLLRCNA